MAIAPRKTRAAPRKKTARSASKARRKIMQVGDDIADPKERAALLAALDQGLKESRQGKGVPIEAALDMLREIREEYRAKRR